MGIKPQWSDAPEWAQWLTQDGDGWYCWWNAKPVPHDEAACWNEGDPRSDYEYQDVCVCIVVGNWIDTLEARP